MRKKYLIYILLLLVFLYGCSADYPEESSENTGAMAATEIGKSSYRCITGEAEEIEQVSETETVIVKAFSHRIYTPNNEYIATLTTVVTGAYSSKDATAEVREVSGTFSDVQIDGLTVSEHISDDTTTIVVYWNQTSICHFQYRLSPDGTLKFLS